MTTKADGFVLDLDNPPGINGILMDSGGTGVDLNGTVITNSGTPSGANDLVSISYANANFITNSGGTISGNLTISAGGLTVEGLGSGNEIRSDTSIVASAAETATSGFIEAYFGGDSVTNDVQVGSLNSTVLDVAFWNPTAAARMNISCDGLSATGLLDCTETSGSHRIANHYIRAGNLEINTLGSGDRNSWIDFASHGASGTTDFDTRVIRAPGVNGDFFIQNQGTGAIFLQQNGSNSLSVTSSLVNVHSRRIANVATPTGLNDAANKSYVDGAAGGGTPGASTVGQTQLKTTTGVVSTTGLAAATLAGGQYGFWPEIRYTGVTGVSQVATVGSFTTWDMTGYSGSTVKPQVLMSTSGSTYVTQMTIRAWSSLTPNNTFHGTAYVRQRYVQSSPPYDLGDGEIPMFIFAKIDNTTGRVVTIYEAPEAPWHNNGPTIIMPDKIENGIPYKRVLKQEAKDEIQTIREALGNKDAVEAALASFMAHDVTWEYVPITQEMKQADMTLLPKPWADEEDHTTVLIDPVTDDLWRLLELEETGEVDIHALIYDDYIHVDNTALPRFGPPYVDVVSFSWKNTT